MMKSRGQRAYSVIPFADPRAASATTLPVLPNDVYLDKRLVAFLPPPGPHILFRGLFSTARPALPGRTP
jgi:hypothetical protein